jgi:hypothetical protein
VSLAARLQAPIVDDSEEARPKGPYLRLRMQPKRRVSVRVIAMLLIGASLLFTKVWERTVANSLSMERDHLAREVRSVENRIRITRDLEEQSALRSGLDLTSLGQLGFQAPDPARVVDVELAVPRPKGGGLGLGQKLLGAARRALPSSLTERVVGLPAAPVEAGGTR